MSSAESYVSVTNLGKSYGQSLVVNDVNFEVSKGSVLAVIGPSGCGKSTTLKCLAGLERPNTGTIRIGGKVVDDADAGKHLPPDKRDIGMVFQSYAVWPHMTVFENVAFPLRVRNTAKQDMIERVHRMLELTGIENMHDRPAPMLSGGQQQRVALARALVANPSAILFDEPLSNLDARLRERMRFELAELQSRIGFTGVYVTHDQEEALAVAQSVVVMNAGQIVQAGDPTAVYNDPVDPFVAEFLGVGNALNAITVSATDQSTGTVNLKLDGGEHRIVARAHRAFAADEPMRLMFRPESVRILDDRSDADANRIEATVESAFFLGKCIDYTLTAEGQEFRYRDYLMNTILQTGDVVNVWVRPGECTAMEVSDASRPGTGREE